MMWCKDLRTSRCCPQDGAQFESNPVLKYASFRSASLEGASSWSSRSAALHVYPNAQAPCCRCLENNDVGDATVCIQQDATMFSTIAFTLITECLLASDQTSWCGGEHRLALALVSLSKSAGGEVWLLLAAGTKFGAALLSGADFSRSNMHTAVLAYSEALDPVIFTGGRIKRRLTASLAHYA
eukprot:2442646-Pleurochrysis_carterae.AAC.7